MKTLAAIMLTLSATAAVADTRDSAPFEAQRPHYSPSATQCIMRAVPGFDPQMLTPAQVARARARIVDGDPLARVDRGAALAPDPR